MFPYYLVLFVFLLLTQYRCSNSHAGLTIVYFTKKNYSFLDRINLESQAKVMYNITEKDCYGEKSKLLDSSLYINTMQ